MLLLVLEEVILELEEEDAILVVVVEEERVELVFVLEEEEEEERVDDLKVESAVKLVVDSVDDDVVVVAVGRGGIMIPLDELVLEPVVILELVVLVAAPGIGGTIIARDELEELVVVVDVGRGGITTSLCTAPFSTGFGGITNLFSRGFASIEMNENNQNTSPTIETRWTIRKKKTSRDRQVSR